MKVEFARPDDEPREVVATVTWDGRGVSVDADDEGLARSLAHAFRLTPVVVDDAAYRRLGTHGSVVIAPADLEWFRAVAQERATAETGLTARFVPGTAGGGYDPAAGYRSFDEQLERLDARSRD
jgi:hypothetical protein